MALREAQGTAGRCDHAWDTHNACPWAWWNLQSYPVASQGSQVRELPGWNLRSSHSDGRENVGMPPHACPSSSSPISISISLQQPQLPGPQNTYQPSTAASRGTTGVSGM